MVRNSEACEYTFIDAGKGNRHANLHFVIAMTEAAADSYDKNMYWISAYFKINWWWQKNCAQRGEKIPDFFKSGSEEFVSAIFSTNFCHRNAFLPEAYDWFRTTYLLAIIPFQHIPLLFLWLDGLFLWLWCYNDVSLFVLVPLAQNWLCAI